MSQVRSVARSFGRVLLGRFAVALAVTVPLVVGGIVGVNVYLDQRVASIPRVKVHLSAAADPGAPANYLVVGADLAAQDNLSDTIMVVHLDPAQKTGFLVSFPRDLLVDIPGVGKAKINAAYNYGPQKTIDTLQASFGIPIQHFVEVNFDSVRGIVDSIGGIPVYFPAPARDTLSGLEVTGYFGFKPGCYILDGDQALGYVRSRSYEEYIDGRWQVTGQDLPDIHRIQRQQTFLRRLATEALRKSVRDPLAANRIADQAIPKLKVDSGLTRDDINGIINAFRHVNPNDPNAIQMTTVPTVSGGNVGGLGDVLVLQQPDADQALAGFKSLSNTPPTSAPNQPAPSSIKVRILNGSGISGAGDATMAALRKAGFIDRGVGDNPRQTAQTELRYRPAAKAEAQKLQTYLGGIGTLIPDRSVVEADVTVVLGRDFKTITDTATSTPPGLQAPTPTTSSQPSTTPPATNKATGKTTAPPDPTQC